jgi:hypothetical protein
MFLGIKCELKDFKEDSEKKSCEFILVMKDNPLNDFVELPSNL